MVTKLMSASSHMWTANIAGTAEQNDSERPVDGRCFSDASAGSERIHHAGRTLCIPMIAFNHKENPITNDFHRQIFKKANAVYNIQFEVPNIETAMFYVSINNGSFIIPSHLAPMANGLVTIPISDERCSISLNLLWKKSNPNPSIPIFQKAFLNFMQDISL